MAAGRPKRFIRSEIEVRQWFLEHLVDLDGNKVSLRDLWWSEEFIAFSGMTGERSGKKSSNGTLSYWVYRKWGLTDKYVYDYHKDITKRISPDISFNDWHRSTLGGKGKDKFIIENYEEKHTKKIINYFLKLINDVNRLDEHSPIIPYWNMLIDCKEYRYKNKELINEFKDLYRKLRAGESIGRK